MWPSGGNRSRPSIRSCNPLSPTFDGEGDGSFGPGSICYGVDLGECTCYIDAEYTSDELINNTYADTYQLFRI